MTIADFQLYCETRDIDYRGEPNLLDAYPLVKDWYKRVGQEKGIKEIHEGEGY